MIKIENVRAVNKGSFLAVCDVHIIPWKIILHEIKLFENGAQRWIGLPSKEILVSGEKKYVDMMSFDNETSKKRFKEQIIEAINAYLLENPDMKPNDVITTEDHPPF